MQQIVLVNTNKDLGVLMSTNSDFKEQYVIICKQANFIFCTNLVGFICPGSYFMFKMSIIYITLHLQCGSCTWACGFK